MSPITLISASAWIVRSSLISASFQFAHIFVNVDLPSKHLVNELHKNGHTLCGIGTGFCSHRARSVTDPSNVTRTLSWDQFLGRVCFHTENTLEIFWDEKGALVSQLLLDMRR